MERENLHYNYIMRAFESLLLKIEDLIIGDSLNEICGNMWKL